MHKKKTLLILLACAFILLLVYVIFDSGTKPAIEPGDIKESALIEYPPEYNYRQSINDCGPFNAAAAVRALRGTDADSTLFAREIGWRLPNKYTLPWGLESQLKEKGITIDKPSFKLLADEEKITLIQQYLSASRPIIILGERDHYEHYLTILGFDSGLDEYYIYDSLEAKLPEQTGMTIDDNDDFPGNKTMKSQEILNFWRGGGMYGLWEWYGLVVSL